MKGGGDLANENDKVLKMYLDRLGEQIEKLDSYEVKKTQHDKILDDLIYCQCNGDGELYKPDYKKLDHADEFIKYMIRNLPGGNFVFNKKLNLMFSNNLTTGDENGDKKLDAFMYAKNIEGVTNLSVYQNAVLEAMQYGKSGLRFLSLKDGIINVNSRRYGSIRKENDEYIGFRETIGYLLSIKNEKIRNVKFENIEFDAEQFKKTGQIIDKERSVMILSKENFLNLRNDTSKENGVSPFFMDQQRLKLLVTIFNQLNNDIEYDGPGRLILWLKEQYGSSNNADSAVGTSDYIEAAGKAKEELSAEALKQLKAISKSIKESGSDQVIGLGNIFENKIEHLPRTTKATEFLDYIGNTKDVEITAQIAGISPVLIDVGESNGNISQESKIDNAMLNDVVPEREKFATQFSAFLAPKLGVKKIYHDKYELKQAIDENKARVEIADQISKISTAANTTTDKKVKADLYLTLDSLSKMLRNDLYSEGELKKMQKAKKKADDEYGKIKLFLNRLFKGKGVKK